MKASSAQADGVATREHGGPAQNSSMFYFTARVKQIGAQVVVPFGIHRHYTPISALRSLNTSQTAKVNDLVIRLSDKFVYSRTFSVETQRLVDNCGGSVKYGETAFLLPGRPSVKEFMRKRLGLDIPSASSAG